MEKKWKGGSHPAGELPYKPEPSPTAKVFVTIDYAGEGPLPIPAGLRDWDHVAEKIKDIFQEPGKATSMQYPPWVRILPP